MFTCAAMVEEGIIEKWMSKMHIATAMIIPVITSLKSGLVALRLHIATLT
jgi:hypothetical protein